MRELEGILYIVVVDGVNEMKLLVDCEIVVAKKVHCCCGGDNMA